jgi:hypothetical protein
MPDLLNHFMPDPVKFLQSSRFVSATATKSVNTIDENIFTVYVLEIRGMAITRSGIRSMLWAFFEIKDILNAQN